MAKEIKVELSVKNWDGPVSFPKHGTPRQVSLHFLWGMETARNDLLNWYGAAKKDRSFDWRYVNTMRQEARSVYNNVKKLFKAITDLHEDVPDGIGRPRRLLMVRHILRDLRRARKIEGIVPKGMTAAQFVARQHGISVRTLYRAVADWRKDHPEKVREPKAERLGQKGRRKLRPKKDD
jgi:hypothetical protein